MYDEAEARDIHVIVVAQEDKDLTSHARFHKAFKPEPRFEILADLNREKSTGYKQTTTYFIEDGVVRQIFPQSVRNRAEWKAVFSEVDRIRAQDAQDDE